MSSVAGLIANPASGKDIRRLVAHASVFSSDQKLGLLRRVLLGLDAAGVERVLYMPDPHRMVERAADALELALELAPVASRLLGDARDTTEAAARMAELGAGAIVSLGGDGTQRALARGAERVPLVPISTGTNNVFPFMVEGTVAGLAAGALATGAVAASEVTRPCKRVELELPDRQEIALIDAVVLRPGFTASRAIWETEALREVVLTRAHADAVGMAAVGGMLETLEPDEDAGLHLVLGEGGPVFRAAIAPGLIRPVAVARVRRLALGAPVPVHGPALLALDGERELSLAPGARCVLRVTRTGPPVVDVGRCLACAARAGFLRGGPGIRET